MKCYIFLCCKTRFCLLLDGFLSFVHFQKISLAKLNISTNSKDLTLRVHDWRPTNCHASLHKMMQALSLSVFGLTKMMQAIRMWNQNKIS